MIWWLLAWGGLGVLAMGIYAWWRSGRTRWANTHLTMTDKRYCELLDLQRRQDQER